MLFLVGLLVIATVAAATFGVVQALGLDEEDIAADDPAIGGEGGDPSETPLAPNQVEVTGIATGVTVEGATIDRIESPLVVTAPQGAGGGTLTDVEVDGELTDIAWDAGRPFDLQGTGGVEPQSLNLFAAPTAITVGFPDDIVSTFIPGSYALETPVAIGRGGLGRPQQSVAFEATVESTLVFRGGATTSILPRELTLEASGRVLLQGTFRVRRSDGTVAEVAGVELPEGEYRITATPRPDATGYDIEALLQGQVNVV